MFLPSAWRLGASSADIMAPVQARIDCRWWPGHRQVYATRSDLPTRRPACSDRTHHRVAATASHRSARRQRAGGRRVRRDPSRAPSMGDRPDLRKSHHAVPASQAAGRESSPSRSRRTTSVLPAKRCASFMTKNWADSRSFSAGPNRHMVDLSLHAAQSRSLFGNAALPWCSWG